MRKTLSILAAAATLAAGCALDAAPRSADQVDVVIGYQSKTINIVANKGAVFSK